MKSIFDIVRFQINNLNLMTEFLEACDWDDDECSERIKTVLNLLECYHLPTPGMEFDKWLNKNIKPSLEAEGLSIKQAEIIIKNPEPHLVLLSNQK